MSWEDNMPKVHMDADAMREKRARITELEAQVKQLREALDLVNECLVGHHIDYSPRIPGQICNVCGALPINPFETIRAALAETEPKS